MDYRGVLVGLGNPGPKYERTRHNTGFLLVDKILDLAHLEGRVEDMNGARFDCELWRVTLDALDGTWLVAKPLLAWHKLGAADLVVAHDELDLPPGSLRFKFGGGNAGHNGLKSITELLGTQNFYRLRIGIGRPRERFQVSDWVLTTMKEEAPLWEEAMDSGVDVLSAFAKKGLERAVTLANRASKRIAEEAAKESEEKKA